MFPLCQGQGLLECCHLPEKGFEPPEPAFLIIAAWQSMQVPSGQASASEDPGLPLSRSSVYVLHGFHLPRKKKPLTSFLAFGQGWESPTAVPADRRACVLLRCKDRVPLLCGPAVQEAGSCVLVSGVPSTHHRAWHIGSALRTGF